MKGRLAPEIYDVRLPSCYANEPLVNAATLAAQRKMMSVSQYIRLALLEAVARDGVVLEQHR
jgi:hypothetical protein